MAIPITVRTTDALEHRREVDISVVSIQHMTIADLANHVSPAAGLPPDLPVAVDGRPVRRDAPALASGVRAGSTVTIGAVGADRRLPVVGHQLRVVGGGDAGHVVDLSCGRVRIGRSPSAELMLDDGEASRLHAEVRVTEDGIWLRDLGSSNGTRIGRHEVTSVAEPLRLETAFRIGNSSLVVSRLREPPASVSERSANLLVHRPKRARPESVEPVEFPVAPATGRRPPLSLASALIPTAASVGIAAAVHNAQLLAFAALTPIMMLTTGASDRWSWRRQNRQARAAYERALRGAEHALAEAATAEEQRRHRDFPDPAMARETVRTVDARLFERATDHPAYLVVRLGLADRPADAHGRRAGIEVSRPMLASVPATVSLRHGSLGIAGPRHLVHGSVRWLLAQVATLHGPSSVHLFLLASHRGDWRWLRWLPGLRQVAETPEEADELIAGLAAEYSRRVASDAHTAAGGSQPAPWLIVVVDAPSEPGVLDRFGASVADGWRVGISFVVLVERAGLIPTACRTSVGYDADHPALLSVDGPADERIPVVVADRISLEYAEQLARGLAPMLDAGTESPTSGRTTERLLELCDLTTVTPALLAAHWSQQSASMTAVPVGTTAAGPLYVDLTVDGPHALIAGSTGSGKSELLRALVLSLAASQPPDRLSMVLIDYKGGAAFAECARLPHACAVITDLDSSTTRRALVSIGAELRRREAAFARARVADLAAYHASDETVRDPIARLVLVVDEFASLADELPGFLDGLLGIAQRGRSLGVHLILATQRPAGIVSADMRANMPLRIALRVTEPAESVDVIGIDAAARIPKSHPGRGFALLSGGLVEFRGARVDLPRPSAEPCVRFLDAWNRPMPATGATAGAAEAESDLSVFCRTAQQAAQLHRIAPATPPWLPALPETVTVADLPVVGESVDSASRISFALVDEPDRQRQYALTHELSRGGAIGFVGSPQSGRSTALRTIAATAASAMPPDALHCHVLDCASGALLGLRSLPHSGSILTKHDCESLSG